MREKARAEARKVETREIVKTTIELEAAAARAAREMPHDVGDIDTDDEKDEEEQYELWKGREMNRIRSVPPPYPRGLHKDGTGALFAGCTAFIWWLWDAYRWCYASPLRCRSKENPLSVIRALSHGYEVLAKGQARLRRTRGPRSPQISSLIYRKLRCFLVRPSFQASRPQLRLRQRVYSTMLFESFPVYPFFFGLFYLRVF